MCHLVFVDTLPRLEIIFTYANKSCMTSGVYGSLETCPGPLIGLGDTVMSRVDVVPDFMEMEPLARQCRQGSSCI